MYIHDARPKSFTALWASRFAIFALCLCLVGFALHISALLTEKEFFLLLFVVAACAVLAFFLSLMGFFALWRCGAYGGRKSLRAFVISLFLLIPLAHQYFLIHYYPKGYDLSTDPLSPPTFATAQRPSDALPVNSGTVLPDRIVHKYWPEITNRRYPGTAEQIEPFVKNAIEELGWQLVEEQKNTQIQPVQAKEDSSAKTKKKAKKGKELAKKIAKQLPSEITLHAVAKKPPFFTLSDIILRLKNEQDSCIIDLRTASRYLPYETLQNAKLIDKFMHAIDQQIFLKQNMGQLYIHK